MALAPLSLSELRHDLARALKLIDDKREDYEKARDMYEGKAREIGGSNVARTIIEQSRSTPISFAHIPVDVIADKIELAAVTCNSGPGKANLQRWSETNDLEDESQDWIRKAGYFGDYYVVTDPVGLDEDGNFTIDDIDSIGLSPLSTVVVYDKKTERIAQYGVHLWDAGTPVKPVTKAILYYDDSSVKLVELTGKGKADTFVFDLEADEEDEDAYLAHDGGRMLISHLAIGGKPYGVPLHRRAWAFQDAIAKISANNLVNVDAQGLPSRWALMDPLADVDDDLDSDFGTDGPTTASGTGDGMTEATRRRHVKSVPGAIAMLRGVKSVGTFDQGDSSGFYSGLDWYVRGMAVACGIPLFEFDLNGEQPSGEARRRAEGRANRKAAAVKRSATSFFREIGDTVLGLVGTPAEVEVTWNPSETSTDKDGLELVSLKAKAGVPLRQALLEAGYTDVQVSEWFPGDGPALSADVLAVVATALAALGNAKTLGVLTDDDLVAMLPELLTAARGEGVAVPELAAPDGGLPIVVDAGSAAEAA